MATHQRDLEVLARFGELAAPINQLVYDLRQAGLHGLASLAMEGEFDATKEEGEEWFKKEGAELLTKDIGKGKP